MGNEILIGSLIKEREHQAMRESREFKARGEKSCNAAFDVTIFALSEVLINRREVFRALRCKQEEGCGERLLVNLDLLRDSCAPGLSEEHVCVSDLGEQRINRVLLSFLPLEEPSSSEEINVIERCFMRNVRRSDEEKRCHLVSLLCCSFTRDKVKSSVDYMQDAK